MSPESGAPHARVGSVCPSHNFPPYGCRVTSVAPDPRVSLSPRAAEIARAARALLEEEGSHALSMRNIASRLGIRAASLYEHFADKRAVENAIMAASLWEQGDALHAALDEWPEEQPIVAIARAFRRFAIAHPELYKLSMSRDLDRDAPDVDTAELYAGEPIRAQVGAHREMSLSIWAFAHGMVDLELNERFPPGFDLDEIWAAGLQSLIAGLERRSGADA